MHNPLISNTSALEKLTSSEQTPHTAPLKVYIEAPLQEYLLASDNQVITDLYQVVLAEVESTLLRVILKHYKNQSKASRVLGLNRGTLRKKLKQYHLLKS